MRALGNRDELSTSSGLAIVPLIVSFARVAETFAKRIA